MSAGAVRTPAWTLAAGFGPVAEAFAEVLADSRGGVAFSVVRRGEPLVELYGGLADPVTGRPWDAGTTAVLFSGTKGLAATVCALLAARGVLDPDAPVGRYWPEFAVRGKEATTVAQVLAHTAGLPYVADDDVDVLDTRAGAAALAGQAPLWEPGTRVAYHALTFGHLVDELVRRTTGRDTAALVASELATLPGVDVALRTPDAEALRMARIVREPGYRLSTFLTDPVRRRIVERMYRVLTDDPELVNSPAYRTSGSPAGGGVGGAGSMARIYGRLADRRDPLVPAPALAAATRTRSEGIDAVNDRPLRFGLGFELADPIGTYGPVAEAFGHSGAGGGRHGVWPEHELGFSFVTNEMRSEDTDTRAARLLDALHGCL
ncbi:CubicO group peptidase (beta-lactamase class C family) [Pseudonocardia sediminis]|uniref:CubicO group peptidase (Beta-lactamase class C family) n=1 Tax=Pseudonocardia sediminis TaxID=1397368 RepID=A0A4Q7UX51_PSEST|nr:serine hydrolase domain-containing protein [Pseudonocardia sediminis]RZT86572.1 CubicO group peptidase (beta-lactamase class C family) [Pseudonocardia sediminis]